MLGIKKWPSGTNFLSKQAIKSFNNGLKLKIMPKNIVEIISKIANLILTIKAELAQGWDFLEIPNARDFLFWARLKNPENPEIPGIGIGILKSRKIPEEKSRKSQNSGDRDFKSSKNPEKIPSAKFRKSRNLGDRDWDLKAQKNPEKMPKKSRVKNPEPPEVPGSGIYFLGIFMS